MMIFYVQFYKPFFAGLRLLVYMLCDVAKPEQRTASK
jgi:hypothetical protein